MNDVVDNNQRDFVKAFNDFLERMPDFHAFGKVKGQGTINWFHPSYILGDMLACANRELKLALKISDIHWKFDDSGKGLYLDFKRKGNFYLQNL